MVVVLGTATLDLFLSGLERIPAPGEDEFTRENLAFCREPLHFSLGGNGANSAYVLARLGTPAALCSAIGKDRPGDFLWDWLSGAGVHLQGLVRKDREATSTTTVIVDDRLQRLSFHHPGASRTFGPGDLPAGLMEEAEALLITGPSLLPGWKLDDLTGLLQRARKQGALTALDLGPALGEPLPFLEQEELLSNLDHLLCNEYELKVATGAEDRRAGMEAFLQAGAGCVVVKRGRKGSTLWSSERQEGPVEIRGPEVEARVTVGAGDTFNAAFLHALLEGRDRLEAVGFANQVAARVVAAGKGALGCPPISELDEEG